VVRLRSSGRFQGRFGPVPDEEEVRQREKVLEGRPRVHLRRPGVVEQRGGGVRTLIILVVLLIVVLVAIGALG
jgi:hypothetical protein